MNKIVLVGFVAAIALVAFPPLFDLTFRSKIILVSGGFLLLVAEILYVRGEIARGRDIPGKVDAGEGLRLPTGPFEE